MSNRFFDQPIINSPYEYPTQHWELDSDGQPTQKIIPTRRKVAFITPIPKPKKRSRSSQNEMVFDEGEGLSTEDQQYDSTSIINEIRSRVDAWRKLAPHQWQVTPETERLLRHWREHDFSNLRPFFCQIEAAETAIWLTEFAPNDPNGKKILSILKRANLDANPELSRIALKLATGAGKTTVMAMLIAWQTVNAIRRPASRQFTRGFLIVAPGITIRDRLRVLLPNDPDNYYSNREIVPQDLLRDLSRAKIVITNYHAFKLRERIQISAGGRRLLKGRTGDDINTTETEGQMIQRVMPELMGMKNIFVINDEAHHCYREKPLDEEEEKKLKGEERREAEKNKAAARLWISGLEAVNRKLNLLKVLDLSATPFFLAGSGYAEGVLFPWTVSDFSLMDAIECGIVKLPRVPIAENTLGDDMPKFRELWKHVGKKLPRAGRSRGATLDPQKLPTLLISALDALYGHYEKTFQLWDSVKTQIPPCFIIVCQNTAISKLVFDYISGFHRENEDGSTTLIQGHFPLFRNFDDRTNKPLPRPNTLLIDSEQLESGDALDPNFRKIAAPEIERFRREIIERSGDRKAAENISDQDLLREVMNTVGKPNTLGGNIRCVVSVSMLTEGWDANNVTHVFGLRAFGTQLLCEQVVGRALRRHSYQLNEHNLFNAEYADVFGIPFDFTAKPVIAKPQPPAETTLVKAMRPERDSLEIRFPRVTGYRLEQFPEDCKAVFNENSILVLSPDLIGPTQTRNSAIIGETADMSPQHLGKIRTGTVIFELTRHLLLTKWRDPNESPKSHLFFPMRKIVSEWLETSLECIGETYPGHLLYHYLADMACDRIIAAISRAAQPQNGEIIFKALLDPYNPTGSTSFVRFNTSKSDLWKTAPDKSHINWIVLDSSWEAEFCRVAEGHPNVIAYVKNHNLGFEVPYRFGSEYRLYRPDFIVLIDDGSTPDDPLHLVVEIKGYRGEDAKIKAETMETRWIPSINRTKTHGRWAFAEFREIYEIETDFESKIQEQFNQMIEKQLSSPKPTSTLSN